MTDKDYEIARNKLIPKASQYANEKHGEFPGHDRDAEAVFVSAIDPEAGAKLDALFTPMKPMSLSGFFKKYSKIADFAEDAILAYEVVGKQ